MWEVLSQADLYGEWVVGAKGVRDTDAGWPAVGTELHHTSGFGPIEIKDTTTVLECQPQKRLSLDAHLGPIGTSRIDIDLRAEEGGTHIVMNEFFTEGPGAALKVLTDAAFKGRNVETLRRLVEIAEERAR